MFDAPKTLFLFSEGLHPVTASLVTEEPIQDNELHCTALVGMICLAFSLTPATASN